MSGELVYVSIQRLAGRGMQLEPLTSRALLQGEIHELIVSAVQGLQPGAAVPDVAYIGFFEVSRGGMALTGDEVWLGERQLGTLAGFDLTHIPNHLNIVVGVASAQSGAELGASVGDAISFRSADGAALEPDGL